MNEQTEITPYDDGFRRGPRSTPHHIGALLDDPSLSDADKRARLAFLASDSHAVPDHPVLRRAEDGSIFHIDDILHALKLLDRADDLLADDTSALLPADRVRRHRPTPHRPTWNRIPWNAWANKRRTRRGPDDDDDPPPCPIGARPFGPAPIDATMGALMAA